MHSPLPAAPLFNRREFVVAAGSAAVGLLIPAAVAQGAAKAKIRAVAFDAFPIFDPRPVFARTEELFQGRGA